MMPSIWDGNNLRDRVVEGDIDFDVGSHQVFNFSEHGKVVLGLDVIRICSIQTGHETTERGNANTFADSQDS